MSTSLFVITSPLQYLNALEALHSYGIPPSQAVLFIVPNREGDASLNQVMRLLDPAVWSRVVVAQGLPPRRLVRRPKFIANFQYFLGGRIFRRQVAAFLGEIGHVERVFVGDWRARSFRHFLGCCPQAQVALLDDGSVTSQAFRYRNDPRDPLVERGAFPSRLGRALSKAGLRFGDPKHLTFFTSYVLPPGRRDTVRQHSFEALKKAQDGWECNGEVWFIGSNHAENGISTEADYLALLSRIRAFFQSETIRYFAHRGENREKLEKLGSSGFLITHSELPLEVVIRDGERYPKVLGAIASSVVDNLAAILGARLAVFLFLAPRAYYRKRVNHLTDIIRYHLQAGGGNLFAIDLRDPRPEHSTVSATYSSYLPLIRDYISISAYGAHTTQPGAAHLAARFSGSTYIPSHLNNTGFEVFLEEMNFSPDSVMEPPWPSLRTRPCLRSAPRPTTDGRRHWLLLEGATENLLLGDADSASSLGSRLRPISVANDVMSPAGPDGAFQLFEDESDARHGLTFQSVPLAEGEIYCLSCYVKRAGRQRVILGASAGDEEQSAHFDLDAKISSTSHPTVGVSLEAGRENWSRISLSFRARSPSPELSLRLLRASPEGAEEVYSGDGLSGVYLFGVQLSRGPVAPVYLAPLKGVPRYRPRDVAQLKTVAAPFEGNTVALLQLHVPAWPSMPIPLLRIRGSLIDPVELRLGPNHLQVCVGSSPAVVQPLPLSAETTRLVLQVQDGASHIDVGLNGSHLRFQLSQPVRWAGPKNWDLGFADDEPFQLLIEEWRIGRGSVSSEDLAALSRTLDLTASQQRLLSSRNQ